MKEAVEGRTAFIHLYVLAAVVLFMGLYPAFPADAAKGVRTMKLFPGEGIVRLPAPEGGSPGGLSDRRGSARIVQSWASSQFRPEPMSTFRGT